MKFFNRSFLYACTIFFGLLLEAQEKPDTLSIEDGPYVFIEEDGFIEVMIKDGVVSKQLLPADSYPIQFENEPSEIDSIPRIVVLSDIHGQLDLFQSILVANGIVDENLRWAFGDGHMVIVGDIFDRGPQVTEALWYVYDLDIQAKQAGGRVHFVLGNHEYMPLQNDLRYLNDKYVVASSLIGKAYPELYDNSTVLGRWLRSKNTLFKIGRQLFVHGGISPEFLDRKLSLDQANDTYREALNITKKEMKANPKFDHFHGSACPIWHRGFIEDNMPKEEIIGILNRLEVDDIIVGHTSQQEVIQLYDGLIYCVDSSMKRGKYGEFLLIEGNNHFRLTPSGEKLTFD